MLTAVHTAHSAPTDYKDLVFAVVSAVASILYLVEFVGRFAIARRKKRSPGPAKRFLSWRRLAVIFGAAVPVTSFFVPRTAALILVALVFLAVIANEYRSWRVGNALVLGSGALARAAAMPRAGAWFPVTTVATNDDHFPRIESAVDSFGEVASPRFDKDQSLWNFAKRIVRPGQQVSFDLTVSDPNGEPVEIRALCGAGDAQVQINTEGRVDWEVRNENISDPTFVHVYVRSQRDFHRTNDFDASASFQYRVLPNLAPRSASAMPAQTLSVQEGPVRPSDLSHEPIETPEVATFTEPLDVTPEYLSSLFDGGHSTLQGQKLVQPYVDKRIRVSGVVTDVTRYASNNYSVSFKYPKEPGQIQVTLYFKSQWGEQLELLIPGTQITAIGTLETPVSGALFYLWECELE